MMGNLKRMSLMCYWTMSCCMASKAFAVSSPPSETPPWIQFQLGAIRGGCHRTPHPLGMISGKIRDWQISSSSTYPREWDRGCHERYARLYQPNGLGWCARYKSTSEWLQVDLGVVAKVSGVMTQGRNDGLEWVTSFKMSHSFDGRHWTYVSDQYGNQKVFEGNTDSYSAKHSYLDEPIMARLVRFHTDQWHRHPSMRVELVGCQVKTLLTVCNELLSLPPSAKVSVSSEKTQTGGSSCQADDAFIFTNKAWCAKTDNPNQWLQFDIGPPTLVTGLVTKGRGDGGKNHWVKRFRLSYSNDSSVWYFYKDSSHPDAKPWIVANERSPLNVSLSSSASSSSSSSPSSSYLIPDRHSLEGLEFGGNSDKNEERFHSLSSPFVARYVRFHPVNWHRHISMRAGLVGCPFKGPCPDGFVRLNEEAPCVENLAYMKDSWVNRRHLKRHVRNQWIRGQANRAVDGHVDLNLTYCTVLDNFHVDRPTWMVDLGRKVKISGVVIQTWVGNDTGNAVNRSIGRDYMHNLEKLVVYVDNKDGNARNKKTADPLPGTVCGEVSRQNDALYRSKLRVACRRPTRGRFVYVEAWGVANGPSKIKLVFSAVLCEVWVYE